MNDFNIGETVYFFGCGNNCSHIYFYQVTINKISDDILDGKIVKKINDRYFLEGCHKTKQSCIDYMRQWLNALEDADKKDLNCYFS